jgi:ADP-ribose pyrophosphatase
MNFSHNPWKKLQTTPVYDNPWIRVEEDRVLRPNGSAGIYGRVHFKNKAIGIIPLDEERNTWLVGQYRYTLNEYSWEIPMGGGSIGEDILVSARRELEEETGLLALRWTRLLRIHTSNSVTDEEGFVFLAEDLTAGQPHFDETEELQIRKLPFAEALEMAMRNEITDALSLAGIFKLAIQLGL